MFAGQLPSPSVPGRQPAGIKGWTRADAIMQRSTSTAPQPLTEPARTIPARWRLNPRLRENLGSAVTFALGIRKHIMHIHRSGSAQRLPSRPKLFSVLVELGTQNQKRLDHSMTVLLGEWRNVHTKLATESARIAGFSVLLECC